jgi:membrane-bound lytic murein transglycosylase F
LNAKTKKSVIFRTLFWGVIIIAIAGWLTRSLFHYEEEQKDAIRRIRERGYLIALTDQNTLNYFVYRGEPMGYQLMLLEAFSKYLGVPLKIISSNKVSTLEYYLRNNAADLIALNLPVTFDGKKRVQFSNPFGETRLVLVQRSLQGRNKDGASFVKSIREFPKDTLFVRENPYLSSFYHLIYRQSGRKAILKEIPEISQEDLILKVSKGEIRYALCQENVARVYKRYYRNIDVSVVAYPHFKYSWGVTHASDTLLTEINKWLGAYKSSGELKKNYLEYFDNQRVVNSMQSDYFSVSGCCLSPYDDIFREQSKLVYWDWRLIASLVYEESNFRQGQISTHNAIGLMQLIPETAAKFGIDSMSTPARQISGGIKYLRYLDAQLPEEISDPCERVYFVLAAYNVGIGRVLAAREKAEQFGKDKNKWNRHVDYYLLRRSKKDPQMKPDSASTYPIDYKTEGFVDNIITRYYHYRNLIR